MHFQNKRKAHNEQLQHWQHNFLSFPSNVSLFSPQFHSFPSVSISRLRIWLLCGYPRTSKAAGIYFAGCRFATRHIRSRCSTSSNLPHLLDLQAEKAILPTGIPASPLTDIVYRLVLSPVVFSKLTHWILRLYHQERGFSSISSIRYVIMMLVKELNVDGITK